jgi:rhodanese-related sulfurtransferase
MSVKVISFAQVLSNKENNVPMICIDVRSPEEFAEWRVSGFVNVAINNPNFGDNILDFVDGGTNVDIIIMCKAGYRSAAACQYLQTKGFDNCYNMVGGILEVAKDFSSFIINSNYSGGS